MTKRHQGLCSRLPDGYLLFLAKNPKEEFRHPLWFREWKKGEDQRQLELRLMILAPPTIYSQVMFNHPDSARSHLRVG